MRIEQLYLKAFGPFTECRLDFSRGRHGLHVIFGPNEAGKSSALRALKALLYGVDERTADGFLHPNDRLRVGGTLTREDGRTVSVMRRKGRKKTLLSANEEQGLDDDVLNPFISGVTPQLFSSLFGIDHDSLVNGGDEILQHNGEVGSALFAAALGGRGLQALVSQLESTAGDLYKSGGSRSTVNKALADYKEARKVLKDSSLAVKDWEAHQDALDEATRRLTALADELDGLLKEENAVKRLKRLLPRVGLRRETLAAIAEMGSIVDLPADFSDQCRSVLEAKARFEESMASDEKKLALLRAEIQRIDPHNRLLAEEGTIRSLYKGLGAYLKAVADRPAIDGKRQQARNHARDVLKRLRPELPLSELPPLRPGIMAAKRPVQELAGQHQGLAVAERKARNAAADIERAIAALREALRSSDVERDPAPLKRAIAEARRGGDLDTLLRGAVHAEEMQARQCEDEFGALGLWKGPAEAARSLPVPTNGTMQRFADSYQRLSDRRRDLVDERRRLTAELRDAERSLEAIRLGGAVPTEIDLTAVRTHRAGGWTLIRRSWLDHEDVTEAARQFDPERILADAFEVAQSTADDVADRLRREADRVALLAQALARGRQLENDLAQTGHREAQLEEDLRLLQSDWNAQWIQCGIIPLPPNEMRAWLARLAQLQEHQRGLTEARERTGVLTEAVTTHKAILTARLLEMDAPPAGAEESLTALLERAEAETALIDAVTTQRAELKRLLDEQVRAQRDLERAKSDLENWSARWVDETRPLGVGSDASPAHVQSLLESYGDLFAKVDEEDDLRRRVYGIDAEISGFDAKARSFIKEIAPELEDTDLPRSIERLNDALALATTDRTRREALEDQARSLALQVEETEVRLKAAEDRLVLLCQEAQCEAIDGLEAAGRQSQAATVLREKLATLDEEIVVEGEGATLDSLLTEAATAVADELPVRLERTQRRLSELREESDRLREQKGAEASALARMTGESAAADAAGRAQEILASLRRGVESYLRTRVAAVMLRRGIERYRQANQDPLLVRAGELFAALACGSFIALSSEISDDEPRLVGVRPNRNLVHVDGMSSGTRDQLYLALRFATLERYLATSEPIPFIVDDILINFDDDRALATLKVLADLSAKTQVLLFTHHTRISEMSAGLQSGHGVFIQTIGGADTNALVS